MEGEQEAVLTQAMPLHTIRKGAPCPRDSFWLGIIAQAGFQHSPNPTRGLVPLGSKLPYSGRTKDGVREEKHWRQG
jgi:hypothetical protein